MGACESASVSNFVCPYFSFTKAIFFPTSAHEYETTVLFDQGLNQLTVLAFVCKWTVSIQCISNF